jgi:uncharacterized radical SAM superfamily Fe-S cluster-containing enzyme
MATTFKNLSPNDVVSTRTLLNEAIPLTGTLFSGTYSDNNIKNYSHGMFQSVYDYPYLSSSANHIVDMTFGFSATSTLSASSTQTSKKLNIYNQMAQMLVGYDATGSIMQFDRDGNIAAGGSKHAQLFFFNFSRLLTKDEIKKGSFSMSLMTGAVNPSSGTYYTIYDANAQNDYRINSPAGEYGLLYSNSSGTGNPIGLLYYQAGIAAVNPSLVFNSAGYSGSATLDVVLSGSTIETNMNVLRTRIANISFNNTTELNSTVYFCRASHNEFNYSANPTYLSSSKMVVKNVSTDMPASYITTVGLYSADNELLAVAKTSEPLKKDPTNELTLRVRLDY